MSEETRKPAYFAIIPAKVRYDTSLRPNAKLLYAEITALADARGYCWSSNDYFAGLFGLSPKTVSDLIGTLDKRGYITVQVLRDDVTNEVMERRLWVEQHGMDDLPTPPPKNKGRGTPPKNGVTSPQKCGDPPLKNREKNNTSINNKPPISPKGEVAQDVLFERFWKVYPRHLNKDRALRAWKKLKPNIALCKVMAAALEIQKSSEAWTHDGGKYIPHAATWLNGRRWEDEVEPQQAGQPPAVPPVPRQSRVVFQDGEEVVVFD